MAVSWSHEIEMTFKLQWENGLILSEVKILSASRSTDIRFNPPLAAPLVEGTEIG